MSAFSGTHATRPMQIDFYLLAKTQVADKHHYACRIARIAHSKGMTVFMQTADAAHSELLDRLLWTFAQDSFVPHAVCANGEHDSARYPVQIGHAGAPPDCAGLLIPLAREAAPGDDCEKFQRIAEVVLNEDADKAAGRARFRFYRERGFEPRTHNIT